MIPFFGAMVRLKGAYEWLNFTNDTVSLLGIVKRAAAATATVAVVAGAGVGIVKGEPSRKARRSAPSSRLSPPTRLTDVPLRPKESFAS